MKKILKKVTAVGLAAVMLSITPLTDLAPRAAENAVVAEAAKAADGDTLYISEVQIGMGEKESEAKKELEEQGFTILTDGDGNYADLNKGAGSKSALKRGANNKIVYLGYKTTTDPSDAITDLAVMNMNGGYSIEEYNILMDRQMDSQIKPFVDRFISTLQEYRANYEKPAKTVGHIRADYMRRMMNRMTDDDTGMPVGDLLLNETKYEMGDSAYDALSDSEKKQHADILTLLMQANGQATLTMETLLTKATDTGNDTWIDRFTEITLDDLIARVQDENPSLTSKTDIYSELDKRYYDVASGLLKKWDSFYTHIQEYEDKAEDIVYEVDETSDRVEYVSDIKLIGADQDDLDEYVDVNEQVTKEMYDAQTVAVCSYLESVEYEDGTLLDFFSQKYDTVSSDSGIRKLYPIVDALTAGQIAGLDFVSFEDLVSIAVADEDTYKDVEAELEKIDETSIYEGVDRGIYEKGGVALTSDALRARALENETDSGYTLGTLPIIMWSVTAGCAIAAVATRAVVSAMARSAAPVVPQAAAKYTSIWSNATELAEVNTQLEQDLQGMIQLGSDWENAVETQATVASRVKALQNGAVTEVYVPSTFTRCLSYGMAAITVILVVVSTVFTVLDAMSYYDTEYIPIPNYMVDEVDITAYNEKNEKVMIKNQTAYYKVVKCNRKRGSSSIEKKNYESMGENADLDGDIGKQWLALYSVKYENGTPILANSLLYQKNSDTLPSGYSTGIHEFGSKAACDLNKKAYLFASNPPSIKVFFKNETQTVKQLTGAGAIFSAGSLALGGGVGLIVGALLSGLIVGRRRKKQTARN